VAEDLHRDARMHVAAGEQRAAAAAAVVDGDGADRMITRALDAGVSARWVAGDEVYGADPALRAELEARRVGYVLAIGCDRRVPTAAGRCVPTSSPPDSRAGPGSGSRRGAKGQRYYDWALITHPDPAAAADTTDSQCWWLLVRRHRDTGELGFYRCYSPQLVPLRELVRVAGRRWTVEESFQAGRGLAGLAITPSFALLL
jgi:SRSO17 transposase